MPLDLVHTLCDLVRLPSVNPMGRDVSGEQYLEHRVTDYLQGVFEQLGLAWQRQTIAPGQDNILARLDGEISPDQGGRLVMLEVHQDTVPVEGMTISPWSPEIRCGRVYGRGACDIKGGMACILSAVSRLAEERPAGMPTVVVACSVNEEFGDNGACHMPRLWEPGDSSVVPRRPDAAIVLEPTELNIVVVHKGTARWRCHTRGRAAHSSQPERGENAVYHMAHVVSALEQYAEEVLPQLGEHPLVGRPTLSVGVIRGGSSVNTVPDECTIEIDRRLLPREALADALEHVRSYLGSRLEPLPELIHDEPHHAMIALPDDLNGDLADRLSEVVQRCGGPGQRIGVPYGTDAPAFSSCGIPTVVFGPGSIAQAHTADEWVAVDQLQLATRMLYEFVRQYR